jgi:D-alanyl-D-alanine carboxypeptidase
MLAPWIAAWSIAGRCLIGSATKNDWQVISVVFGEPSSASRINDSVKILNFCFENYKFVDLREIYKINFSYLGV